MKTPENEEETISAYLGLAEKLGYSLTAEEIRAGVKALAQEQRSKTEKAVSDMEKAPLDEETLEAVSGGEKGDYHPETCDSTFVEGEWCWLSESCSYLIDDVGPVPAESHREGVPEGDITMDGLPQDLQNSLYNGNDDEIHDFIYGGSDF